MFLVSRQLLLFESVFSLLSLVAGLLAVLVVLNQIFESLALLLLKIVLANLELFVFLVDLVNNDLVCLHILFPGRINCSEKSLIFLFDFDLLLLLGINLLVDSPVKENQILVDVIE